MIKVIESDQIDMMFDTELRAEFRKLVKENTALKDCFRKYFAYCLEYNMANSLDLKPQEHDHLLDVLGED